MVKRLITSLIAICVLIPVLIFSGTWVFPIALSAVSVIALYELFKCMGVHKRILVTAPLYIAAAATPIMIRGMGDRGSVAKILFAAACLYLIIVFADIIWSHGKFYFADGMATFILAVYIIAGMSGLVLVRDFDDNGMYIYLLIFLGAWTTDVFAYFTGKLFGKHKLIEDVSPKKTVEGSIGGTVFCVLVFITFGIIVDVLFEKNANILFLAISGAVVSLVSQIGDLIMSVIKRHYGIKDYGKIFPGHGGVLDRFDSILAVSVCMIAICLIAQMLGISLI